MLQRLHKRFGLLHILFQAGIETAIGNELLYNLDSQRGRMHQIVGIETIVAQVIHHKLIDRQIFHLLAEPLLQGFDSQKQGALGELVTVQAIPNMSNRTHSEDKVLDDISLTIQPGTTVGIIGSTGCGKSTLVSMIPRLYDPDEGEVLVDGVNVKDYSLYNLREGVGMVLQKNVLFSGTIAENLRWGDEEATAEEMTAMATAAQADKFVSTFKEGYETQLDKGGNNLSGGQKQRLCIARALMKKPKILILDDSTSAVDTATEAQIRHAFSHELAGSTKIIIAQRIASVMDADRIIVMNEGKITGVGTHEELLVSNTEYQEIAESQLGRKGA